jgi:hypothetical protein
MLESMSLWTGIRSLLVIAALLYLSSWVALVTERTRARSSESRLEPADQNLIVTGVNECGT